MITIIHGSDSASSRKHFLDQKEQVPDSNIIDGSKLDLTDLLQIFQGGLFNEPGKFFIESIIGKRQKSRELDSFIETLNKYSADNNIYLWEAKDLSSTRLKQFKNPVNKQFRIPATIFLLLDSLKPKNGKELIRLFHKTIETTDAEMVFFMIVKQIRYLIALSEPSDDQIDEIKKMAPWQKSKLQKQADLFEIGELKRLYANLFEIEKDLKTGNLPLNIVQAIDLLLISI